LLLCAAQVVISTEQQTVINDLGQPVTIQRTVTDTLFSNHSDWQLLMPTRTRQVTRKNFICLSLDLPPAPLFKDGMDKNIIPQIPLFDLLAKYDGIKEEVCGC